MSKGGYKIIDLHNVNLTVGEAVTIKGLYESIESNYNKATLLAGIVISNIEKQERYVVFTLSGTSFVTTVDGKTLTITDEDSVTLTN